MKWIQTMTDQAGSSVMEPTADGDQRRPSPQQQPSDGPPAQHRNSADAPGPNPSDATEPVCFLGGESSVTDE